MQFRRENFQLHQLNDQSALAVTLQAGLSALKTPYPYDNYLKITVLFMSKGFQRFQLVLQVKFYIVVSFFKTVAQTEKITLNIMQY